MCVLLFTLNNYDYLVEKKEITTGMQLTSRWIEYEEKIVGFDFCNTNHIDKYYVKANV